jgi:hypothetical protein
MLLIATLVLGGRPPGLERTQRQRPKAVSTGRPLRPIPRPRRRGTASLAQLEVRSRGGRQQPDRLELDALEIDRPGHCLVRIGGDGDKEEEQEVAAALKEVLRDIVHDLDVSTTRSATRSGK